MTLSLSLSLSLYLVVFVSGSETDTSSNVLYTIDLYHTGNVRSTFMPLSTETNFECTSSELETQYGSKCIGGAFRQAAVLEFARSQWLSSSALGNSTHVTRPILVDSGFYAQGSTFFSSLGFDPAIEMLTNLQYDAIGLADGDLLLGTEKLANYIDKLPSSLGVLCANLDISQDPYLSSSRDKSTDQALTQPRIQPWKVINGGNNITVGVVGYMDEDVNTKLYQGQLTLPDSMQTEQSIRLAIAHLQHNHPDCKTIILLSSSGRITTNTRLARNILGLDVIVAMTHEPQLNGATVMMNGVGQPVILVTAGSQGKYLGHTQFGLDHHGIIVESSVISTSIPLNNQTGSNANVLQRVLAMAMDVESRQRRGVIGRTLTDIDGHNSKTDPSSCRMSDCRAAQLAVDAMLWYCKDCDISFQNGGSTKTQVLLSQLNDGNLTWQNMAQLNPFRNSMSTFQLQGVNIVKALVNSITDLSAAQPAGMRYAYNPDTSLPPQQRILHVEIWDRLLSTWKPLQASLYYKVATLDFIRKGGSGYTDLAASVINPNDYWPSMTDIMAEYVTAHSPIKLPSSVDLAPCVNNTVTLVIGSDGRIIWPGNCRIVKASGEEDLLKRCPSNVDMCNSFDINVPVFPGMYVNRSNCKTCSGMGSCYQQKCICEQPKEGMYRGLTMIRGNDCADVRKEWTFSNDAAGVLYAGAALVVAVACLFSAFYAKYRNHRVVKAASPVFLHLVSVGSILGAISMILCLQPARSSTCMGHIWFLALSFGLVFGALVCKTYRLYRIFNQSQLRTLNIGDMHVMLLVGAVMAIEIIVLTVFQTISPLQVTGEILDASEWTYMSVCSSESGMTYGIILIAFNALLLAIGVVLVFEIRNIDTQFNETKALSLSIYNTTIVCALVLPLVMRFQTSSPSFCVALKAAAIVYALLLVLVSTGLPKVVAVYQLENENNSTQMVSGSKDLSSLHRSAEAFAWFKSRASIVAELMGLDKNERTRRLNNKIQKAKQFVEELERLMENEQEPELEKRRPVSSGARTSLSASETCDDKGDVRKFGEMLPTLSETATGNIPIGSMRSSSISTAAALPGIHVHPNRSSVADLEVGLQPTSSKNFI